ncbi:MAG: dockerin type I repeat-containing protein, partial [Clostridia bacterium]|nr:dockerin type I repeat-containing protein [Clostridia bacterium]
GPCYLGVWFGEDYSVCAAYDFSAQKFVIGTNNMEYGSSISDPFASKAYSWTRMSSGNYPLHRFALKIVENTATIYIDGIPMLSYTDPSFASSDDILLMYTKGEFIIDNITVSNSDYDVTTGSGATIMKVDFQNGSESLSDWTLGGYTPADIREFDMSEYFSDSHVHTNVLVASHEATYFHGSYDEYECSSCHKRTVVEVGGVLEGDVLVHVSAFDPTCTVTGHNEYWYDREGRRFSDAEGKTEISLSTIMIAASGHDLTYHPAVQASVTEEGFVEYWNCSRCKKNFADAEGKTEIGLVKTDATREVESAITAIGKVKYREESSVYGTGIVGKFTSFGGNSCYSVLDVGNRNSKLNADYTVEMLIRIRDVDKTTEIGGASGAFFGLACENFTVGYDFVSEKWGVSPISGLFASYAFNPSETGPMCVLDDGYFHTVTFECTTEAIRVFVDGVCVLNESSLVRENNRYCIFYPRLCTVEFASYGFMYDGVWVNDHLTGRDIVSASTWTSRGSAYGTTVKSFNGSKFIDSLRAIEYAEVMYDALSENEKLLVSNYAELVTARNMYEWLASRPPYGDATGDGKINLSDVSSILQYVAKWDIEVNTEFADVNCDGIINLTDVSMILKYIAKWDIILGI